MIDWEEFHNFFQSFGNNVIIDIIDTFVDDHQKDMKLIEQAIKDKDFPTIRFSSHHIKGSIGTFRDPDTAKIAYKLEEMGENNIEDGLKEAFAELQPAVKSLMQELLDYRKKITS